jgi:hypothetical protein
MIHGVGLVRIACGNRGLDPLQYPALFLKISCGHQYRLRLAASDFLCG